jgi:hypothetical protein
MVDPIDKFLGEAEFTFDTLNVDNAYDIFNQSYIKSTGKSWDKDKFIERAINWTFYGDENGYVAVRVQNSGMVKLVGVAGSPKSIYKGIQEVKNKYSNMPLWGMVSKEIANQSEKMGFKVLRLKNDISAKIFLKLIKTIIPSSVFGGAKINGINSDGTIGFEYSDVGEANKVLVGNEMYFNGLKEKITASDKVPEFVKNKLDQLFLDSGLLSEKRRGGEKNPKIPYTEMLDKYMDRDDIYITFTHLVKAGINPNSSYDTPLGVYCFPLKKAAEFYGKKNGVINFPFAAGRPYIFILKEKNNIKKIDVSKYTESDGEEDIKKIIEIYKDKVEDIEELLNNAKAGTNFRQLGVGVFWYFCKLVSENLGGKLTVNWNTILRKDLGYGLVFDGGYGVIHSNEKCQAFFTDSSKFEIINYLDNPNPSDLSSEDEWKAEKSKRKDRGRSSQINLGIVANDFKAAAGFLKTRNTTSNDLAALLQRTKDKQKMVDLIIKTKRNRIDYSDIPVLFYWSTNKEKVENDILSIRGSSLGMSDIDSILEFAVDKKKTVEKILSIPGIKLNYELIRTIQYKIGWNEDIAIQMANIKGDKLTGEDVEELFRSKWKAEKSDKLANTIFNLKKNSLDAEVVMQLLLNCVDEKKMIDQIVENGNSDSMNDKSAVLALTKYPIKERESLAIKLLKLIGSKLTDTQFAYIFSSIHDEKNIKAASEYILDVKNDMLTHHMIENLLRYGKEDPSELIPKILKVKKLTDLDKKAILKNVENVNQFIEMVGGISTTVLPGVDISNAKDVNGLLNYVIENGNKFDYNTINLVTNSAKTSKERLLNLKKISTKDPSMFMDIRRFSALVYSTEYMDPDDKEEMMNYILEHIKNNPINSANFGSAIIDAGNGKYIEKLIDAVNVRLESLGIKTIDNILRRLYPDENSSHSDIVKKIYNYSKMGSDQFRIDIIKIIFNHFPKADKFLTERHLNYKQYFNYLYS